MKITIETTPSDSREAALAAALRNLLQYIEGTTSDDPDELNAEETITSSIDDGPEFTADLAAARRALESVMSEFPFAENVEKPRQARFAATIPIGAEGKAKTRINFADTASHQNYLRALSGEKNEHGIRPIVLITSSRSGSGKTALAKHILRHHHPEKEIAAHLWNPPELRHQIFHVLSEGYLFFDNFCGNLESPELSEIVTSQSYRYRKLFSQQYESIAINLHIVITGNVITLSPDMIRRCIVIELL